MSEREVKVSAQALAEACGDRLYSLDQASRAMGIELLGIEPGRAVMSMKVRDDMLNGHASCHGGFLFALADSAFAFACNSRNLNTLGLACTIDYLRPTRLGEVLTAVAEEKNLAGRTGLYDVSVTNETGEEVALFRGKSYRVRGNLLPELNTEHEA